MRCPSELNTSLSQSRVQTDFHLLDYGLYCKSYHRLHEFVEKGRVSLSHCNYLVLDEADRMLDMGFMPEIQKMVENEDMPKKAPEGQRQTLMFSATFPDEVQESAQEFLADDYLFLTVGLVGGACSDVKQVKTLKCSVA